MNSNERKELKEAFREMASGRRDGLDIDTPFHWVVEGLKSPELFFEHLPILLPSESVLYIEGTRIDPEVAVFYSAHLAQNAEEVARDTIYPAPKIFHVVFSPSVCGGVRQLARNHPTPEMFDHLKAYSDGRLLFTFHDAFDGWLLISDRVPEESVREFTRSLAVSARRAQTKAPNPEHFRSILVALECVEREQALKEGPWYKRLWAWLTGP